MFLKKWGSKVLINLSKHKGWRVYYMESLQKTKKIKKRTDTSLWLHAVETYGKVESINTHNDYETSSKK